MRCLRFLLLAVAGALLFTTRLIALGAEAAPRISAPVDENSLFTLQGNVPLLARAEFDRGAAAPSTRMLHVRLVLSRTIEQQSAMSQYQAELQDKSSPSYHQWLTPEQFGKLYGPADADIAIIVAWLQSHDLQLDPVPPGRSDISFSGTVQQIEELLHTSIHIYQANGEEFLSNSSNPAIPAALAGVVSGVAHLNTIRPKPQHARVQLGMFDPVAGRLKPVSRVESPRPELTHGGGTTASPYQLFLVAGDAATIYDTPNSFNANFSAGSSYTGTGVTIGIAGDAVITPGIVANYRTRFVGDTAQPTITNVDGVTATGDSDEAYLDNEVAGGLAPGAAIHFYTATSLDTAIQQMVNDNTVDIISISFGNCEFAYTTTENQLFTGWWLQASMQGIAVAVATGDNGSAGCDNPNSETVATGGLAVNALGSTPYNVAVGGTDFSGIAAASSFTTYVGTTSSSANLYRTALKYIPESTWNDSTIVNGSLSNNVALVNLGQTNIVAGSGGVSSCSTNTGGPNPATACTSGYAKPFWQRGANVPADGVRDLPDISLMAGALADNAAWLVCTTDTSGTITADCSTQSDGHFYFDGFGGTSASTPAFAGMLALVQQKAGGRLGLAAKELYDLYNGAHAGAIFHDITSGNISVPCATGSLNCATNTAGNLFMTGYNAGTGYDLATGMGSVDATQLITYWGSAIGSQPTTITVQPAATSIAQSTPLSVAVTVTGSTAAGNPTGTVTLSGGGYTSPAQALTSSSTDSATYTFSVPGGSLAKGSDTLTVSYSGDVDYATQTGTATVTVSSLAATITVTPSATTINTTTSLSVAVTVSGTGPAPTGTVTLSGGGYTSPAEALTSGKYTFSVAAGALATGADTLTVTYSGDTNYGSATQTTTVTVNGISSSVSVTPTPGTVGTAQALSVAAVVTGAGSTPTGTVKLSAGGYTSASQSLSGGASTFTVPAGSLAVGSDTLTVTYSGDSTYNGSSGTATVTVVQSTFSLVANPNTLTLTAGATTGNVVQINATPANGYLGSITLTAAVTSSPSGAVSTPVLTVSGSPVNITSANPVAATVTVATTVASAVRGGQGFARFKAAGGTALAALLFLFVPLGSRRCRRVLSILLLVAAAGFTIAGCGGGGGGGTTKITPGVTVSPSKNAISTADPLSVAISVSGGTASATGSVTLSGGGYTSGAASLSSAAATINVPANALAVGTDTLTATYSGDTNYNPASGTASVIVNKPGTTTGAYTITVTGTGNDAAHTTATTTFTLIVQ